MNMGRSGVAMAIGVLLVLLAVPALAVEASRHQPSGTLAADLASEVDVAFLGGGQGEAVPPVAVTATGNGVGAELSSWSVEQGSPPDHLHDSAVQLVGSQAQLQALVAEPDSTTPHLLLATTLSSGLLRLTTWRVASDGTFDALDTEHVSIDPSGGRDIKRFSVTYRTQSASGGPDVSHFQLFAATAYGFSASLTADLLAVRSLTVDASSGEITTMFSGGTSRDTHEVAPLAVTYQPGREEFVVAFREPGGALAHEYWSMAEDSRLTSEGFSISGYTIDGRVDPVTGTAVVAETMDEVAMAAVGNLGLVSALRSGLAADPQLVSWESRDFCDGTGCASAPFRIATDGEDTNPGPGVVLGAPPSLTHSWQDSYHDLLAGGDSWGNGRSVSALATGDVDGDGDAELAIGRSVGDGLRYRILDVEDGNWVALLSEGGTGWDSTRSVSALAMGDVDDDGRDEVAMGRNLGDGMRYQVIDYENGEWAPILKNGGKGWNDLRGITAMAMGDVDNDGDDELAMGRNEGSDMRYQVIDYEGGEWSPVLKNGGEGWPKKRQVTALAMGDFDGDADDDLAIGRDRGDDWRYAVRESIVGEWGTQLTAGDGWGSSRYVTALDAGDVDGDGDDELALGRNDGAGMRYEVLRYDLGSWPELLDEGGASWPDDRGIADVSIGNGGEDGLADLAIALDDGPGMRFSVQGYDPVDETWGDTLAKGGSGWGSDRHPTQLALLDMDEDPHEEFVIGLDAGGGERYRLLDIPTLRRVRASVSDSVIEGNSGEGSGLLHQRLPAGESSLAQNASVGKFLTLLLAVEAITASPEPPNLTDSVLITKQAAEVGGSHAGPPNCDPPEKCLQEGDRMPLDDLLAAMMLQSDNRAAYAIAEHLSGTKDAFLAQAAQRFNDIRVELGLSPRFDEDCAIDGEYDTGGGKACFTHPAGSSLTTDQDLVTLWRYASEYPMFQDFATKVAQLEFCGTNIEGNPKCLDPLFKFLTSEYPGLDGWKGGNGGHRPGFGLPFCTSCLAAATTRFDRRLIVTLRQTGDLWGDHDRLVNWGYRQLYTPDQRGSTDVGPFVDFGLDGATSDLALTATLDAARDMSLCAWQVNITLGTIGDEQCSTKVVETLPAGSPDPFVPTVIDMARIPTNDADGDFVTGEIVLDLEGPSLSLTGWRIGRRVTE